jgi:hypothetical protein
VRLGEAGYGIRVRTRVTAPVFSSALLLSSTLPYLDVIRIVKVRRPVVYVYVIVVIDVVWSNQGLI